MSSTDDIPVRIAALEASGKLVRYEPRFRKPKRRLYLCEQAVMDVTSPKSAFAVLNVQGRILSVFEHWTTGGRVWADPNGKPRFIKPLFPPDPKVWEMLMIEPGAQVRIFFIFAEPDTIIASHAKTRQLLGKRNSQEWIDAKINCMNCWNELFDAQPYYGDRISDYVTENYDEFPV